MPISHARNFEGVLRARRPQPVEIEVLFGDPRPAPREASPALLAFARVAA